MKDFNWAGFKNGEFYVFCESLEDSQDFLRECENRHLTWLDQTRATKKNFWREVGIFGIYYCFSDESLSYSFMRRSAYVKWESPKTNFSWKEVFSLIKEGETYMSGDKHISLKNGHLSIGDSSSCATLHDELFTKKKEERNLVEFTQALKAMQKGHIVYSDFNGFYYKVEDNKLYCSYDDFNQWFHVDLPYAEINSQWLIVD